MSSKKLSKEELNAIDAVSSKATRKRVSEFDIPTITILSIFHKAGRPKNFDILFNQALDEAEDAINNVNKVIELMEKQLDNYKRFKQSIIYDKLLKVKQ